jgi:hypothetical protein
MCQYVQMWWHLKYFMTEAIKDPHLKASDFLLPKF